MCLVLTQNRHTALKKAILGGGQWGWTIYNSLTISTLKRLSSYISFYNSLLKKLSRGIKITHLPIRLSQIIRLDSRSSGDIFD